MKIKSLQHFKCAGFHLSTSNEFGFGCEKQRRQLLRHSWYNYISLYHSYDVGLLYIYRLKNVIFLYYIQAHNNIKHI